MNCWKNEKVGNVCSAIFSGGTPSTAHDEYWDGPYFWLSSGETNKRYITETEKTITQDGVDNSSTRLAKTGDIVIASAGQGKTRGQTSILGADMYINQSVIALRSNKEVLNNKYLFYNLTMRYDELRAKTDASSTRGSLTTDMLKKLSIKLPDLHVQNRIVSVLSAYDELLENNNKRINLLEKTAKELYKEWFVRFRFPGHETAKFKNGLPVGWKVHKVKELVKRLPYGKFYKTEDLLPNGSVITIDQSRAECIGYHNNQPDFTATYETPIALFGDHSCKYQLMLTPFSLSENIIPFVAHEGCVSTTFLFYLVHGLVHTTEYKRHWSVLMNKKVLLPVKELQTRFSSVAIQFLRQIQVLKMQNRNLVRQRDLLLPRLMSGRLEV